jgi:hypothetical protein
MDMTVVTPIAVTSVDWAKLLGLVRNVIGRSVGRGLDSKNITARGIAEFVSALGEFHTENTDPVAAQRNAGFLLKHVSVSFLCGLPTDCIHDLLVVGRVAIVDCEHPHIVIATASLEDWRTTVINLCAENQTKPMRLLGTRLLQAFDDMGLGRIFETYSRRTSTQGGLLLLPQK